MAETQFLHVDGYGRDSRERAKPSRCIGGIIAEAARIPGHCPHIKHPAEPRLLYGETLEEIAAAATLISMQARDTKGRRLRRDGVVLIAGVATHPVPRADMTGSIAEREFYEHWKAETIEWLVNSSDIAVRCIIEHTDEEYSHLHFFALPTLTADFRLNFDAVHPGRKGAGEAAARGACRAAVQSAYVAAMVGWQDNYHRHVSARFGHQRLGPRRQRVTRERHKAIRQTERESDKARADLELRYMLARTPDEVAALARQVNPGDFKLVALAEIMRLRQQLALKTEVIREYGLVDPEEAPPPLPSDQEWPAFPAIPVAEVLEVLDELETFPEPPPAPAESAAAAAWTGEYFARKRAEADQLWSDIAGRQEDPEPPDSDPPFRPG
jgi:hypothetical protein